VLGCGIAGFGEERAEGGGVVRWHLE
jgi:hypothetical protein